ncbi:MAG: hypothetical protein LBF93_06520, partial [Zoogloeaceae bacterium]|nr:hypothetical protein [Zoogloeaceae bacterium]
MLQGAIQMVLRKGGGQLAQFRQGRQQRRLRPDVRPLDAFQSFALFGKALLHVLLDVMVDLADLPVQHL